MEKLESEIFSADYFNNVTSVMNDFYTKLKNVPYELFMSTIAMLIERRVYDEKRDIYEEIDSLATVMRGVNDSEGTVFPWWNID